VKPQIKNIRIDSHVHILPPRRLSALLRWIIRANPAHPVPADITAEMILSDLRAQGVTHFFNFAYPLDLAETGPINDFNIAFCAGTPGAIPFGSLHPDDENKPEIAQRLFNRGCVGIKFHPFVQKFDPWDKRMEPLYDFLEEAQRPVLFHTGFEAFYRMQMPAAKLEALIRKHPRMPTVFVHMMFPEIERAYRLLEEFPMLFLDATNVFAVFRPEYKPMLETFGYGSGLRDVLFEGLCNYKGRIMFGSDHPAGMGSLEQIYMDMQNFGLPPEAINSLTVDAPMTFVKSFTDDFSSLFMDGIPTAVESGARAANALLSGAGPTNDILIPCANKVQGGND